MVPPPALESHNIHTTFGLQLQGYGETLVTIELYLQLLVPYTWILTVHRLWLRILSLFVQSSLFLNSSLFFGPPLLA